MFGLSFRILGAQALLVFAMSVSAACAEENWKAEWKKVVAAANEEGVVSVAGPPQAAERSVIAKFRKSYPGIELKYSGLSSRKFVSRVALERAGGIYEWDVVVGGPTSFYDYIGKKFFRPIRSQLILPEVKNDRAWLGGLKEGFQDREKKFVLAFTTYISSAIKVNRSVIPESELNSAQGLLNPKWKKRIVIYDPRGGGAGSTTVSLLRKELGDVAVKKLLVDQEPVLSTEKRQFTEWVIRGQYPIGIGVVDPYLAPFLEQGIGKDVKTLETRLNLITTGSGTFVVMDRNPHPNATKVFVNWLLSQKVQADWAQTANTNSRRLDVPSGAPDTKPDPKKMDSYINFNREENYAFKAQTQDWAREVRP